MCTELHVLQTNNTLKMVENFYMKVLRYLIFACKGLNNLVCEAVNNLTHNLWQAELANSKLAHIDFPALAESRGSAEEFCFPKSIPENLKK